MTISRIQTKDIEHRNLVGKSLDLFCEWDTTPSVNRMPHYAPELKEKAKYIGKLNGSDLFVYKNEKGSLKIILGTIQEVRADKVKLNTSFDSLSPKDYNLYNLVLFDEDRKYCEKSLEDKN